MWSMLSSCGSHHCSVFPSQKTTIIFKTACEINISMTEDPIYTYPWQPQLARKCIDLFEVCLTWFFRIFRHSTLSAQSTASTGFQWHDLPLQRLFEQCALCHLGTERQAQSRPQTIWDGNVLPIPNASFLQCALFLLKDGPWEVLKSVNVHWRLLWCFKGCSFAPYSAL